MSYFIQLLCGNNINSGYCGVGLLLYCFFTTGSAKEEEELNKAVTVPLYEAYRLGMASLAMPAISTGKYGYPIDVACGILVQAVL